MIFWTRIETTQLKSVRLKPLHLIKTVAMKLHLLRHAKTHAESDTGQDFDRKLTERGYRQCADLKDHLLEKDLGSLTVWCSTAQRTQETWALVNTGLLVNHMELKHELYLCEHAVFLKKIWGQIGTNDLLIVGHNFGISQLASYFIGDDLVMKTSEFITIAFPFDQWVEVSRETGTIHHRYRSEAR